MRKGLEELEKIKTWFFTHNLEELCDLEIIEKELKRLEEIDNVMFLNNKKLKALEIIKEKNVNIYNLKTCKSYEKYVATLRHNYEIFNLVTKEEYDLLKEVLL